MLEDPFIAVGPPAVRCPKCGGEGTEVVEGAGAVRSALVVVGAFAAAVASFVLPLAMGSLLAAIAAPFVGVPLVVLFLVWVLRIPPSTVTVRCEDCDARIGKTETGGCA